MTKEATAHVVVTVNDKHLPTIKSVAKALKAAGLSGINQMPTVGIITGECKQSQMHELKNVAGVEAVEVDQEMKIQ